MRGVVWLCVAWLCVARLRAERLCAERLCVVQLAVDLVDHILQLTSAGWRQLLRLGVVVTRCDWSRCRRGRGETIDSRKLRRAHTRHAKVSAAFAKHWLQ